jgi:hypothetical protein
VELNVVQALFKRRCLNGITVAKSTSVRMDGGGTQSALDKSPSSISQSGLIRSPFPANDDRD